MDVSELKAFYETGLGKFTCRKLRERITKLWPEVSSEKILGFGFALPYLPLFTYGNNCIAFMPAKIGALKIEEASPVAMVDSDMLPAKNEYFDRVMIIHGMENCELAEKLLEEAWRILKPTGKLLIIVPSSGGIWESHGDTPFRGVRSYSKTQLLEHVLYSKFSAKRVVRELFFIPSRFRWINRLSQVLGAVFLRQSAGVFIIEAEKLIFAAGGRPIKIAPTIWDKVFKPKAVAAGS